MKLVKTESFIKEGIKLKKCVRPAIYSFFSTSDALYEYKTVFDLDEAIELSTNGWIIQNIEVLFMNITLNMYRDISSSKQNNHEHQPNPRRTCKTTRSREETTNDTKGH